MRISTHPKGHPWVIAYGVLIFFVILMFLSLSSLNIREDEELSYQFSDGDLITTLRRGTDTHPPLWWGLFWFWRQATGDSEFSGRVHAILFTSLHLALLYQLARSLFGGWLYGVVAMLALGLNPFFYTHATEIRPYPFVLLSVTLCAWFFWRWLKRPIKRNAIFYGLSVALMLYLHYYAGFFVLAQALFLFVVWRPPRRVIFQWAGALIVAALVWLPWLPGFIGQVAVLRGGGVPSVTEWGTAGLVTAPTRPTAWSTVEELLDLLSYGPTVYFWVAFFIILGVGWRKKVYWLALLWLVIPPTIVLFLNQYIAVYLHHYVVYITIGLALVISAGLGGLPHRLNALVIVGFGIYAFVFLPTELPQRVPYRALFKEVSSLAEPQDVIFFDVAGLERSFIQWHIRHYLDAGLFARQVHSVEEAIAHRRVWYVTYDWFNPTIRDTFKAIEETHRLQKVVGDCNRTWCYLLQLMEAPPYEEPIIFGGQLAFWGAKILPPSSNDLTVHLWWRVERPPELDYTMSLQLLDSNGILVAQADGIIVDRDNGPIPTLDLRPDAIYIDVRTLSLPSGLPADNYRLGLVVYNWRDGQRLPLPDKTDMAFIGDVHWQGQSIQGGR